MAITDELRKWGYGFCGDTHDVVTAIADRIDAAHAALAAKSDRQREQLAAMEDALRRRNEGELKRRWQREIDALRDERDELREAVRLSEAKASDMVELPKDVNGEPIRIGDVVEWLDESHHPITVVGIGKNTLFYIDDDANAQWTMAKTKRHHAKTIEDVLREMLYKAHIYDEREMELLPDLIAEYAAKLQLREES